MNVEYEKRNECTFMTNWKSRSGNGEVNAKQMTGDLEFLEKVARRRRTRVVYQAPRLSSHVPALPPRRRR